MALSASISQEEVQVKPEPELEPIVEAPTRIKEPEIEELEIQITLKMFNEVYPLKYWSAVLVKVCQVVLIKQPFVVARLSQEKRLDNPGGANFNYIKSDIKNSPRRLHNGLWLELDRTALGSVPFGIERSSVPFYLKYKEHGPGVFEP